MPLKAVAPIFATLVLLSSGLSAKTVAAKKKVHAPVMAQMAGDQKVLHALNRLTFGARPGDMEAVKEKGLDLWIEQQLHPRTIPENPILEAKLAPFDSLRMTTAELVHHYPTPQMVKAMIDGRQQF